MGIADRLRGSDGRRRAVELLQSQRTVKGDTALAEALYDSGEIVDPPDGDKIITQGGVDTEIFFVLAGKVSICVNGVHLHDRHAGVTVGEMSAVNPALARSADVKAVGDVALLRVSEAALATLGERHPVMWHRLAADLAERVEQRNRYVRVPNERPKVLIICSTESLSIANTIQSAFDFEDAEFRIWTQGVFQPGGHPLDDISGRIAQSDFVIAIAQPDDILQVRREQVSAPRANVILEYGMAVMALGRMRSLLLVPRNTDVELPSDVRGLIPISYRDGPDEDLPRLLGPACNTLRNAIRTQGVRLNS